MRLDEPPPADHAARRERLRAALGAAGVPAIVVTSASNVRYLSGFTGSNGQLLVGADGVERLVTDDRYEGRAAVEAPGVELLLDRDWIGRTVAFAGELGLDAVAFEAASVSFARGSELRSRLGEAGVSAVPVEGVVEALRVVKDAHELAALEQAARITDEAFGALLEEVAAGWTERQVAVRLERTMVDLGADGPAFATIAASGPNSAIPHHEPTGRHLVRGDLLKLDFGARFRGYHADMTRTIAIGAPDDELVAVHGLVLRAQQAGVEAAADGVAAATVDAACRDLLTEAGYGDRFVHGTGHGVGLDIHEAPAVSTSSADRLEAGAVITVEPGVYLPGRGGVRIEDTVVVTPDGPARRLTTSPHDLLRV